MANETDKAKGRLQQLFGFLSSMGLGVVCLLILGVLTWLSTLEMSEQGKGLFVTSQKYYDSKAFFVVPELGGKALPIVLPGAYWTSAVLFVNLLLGGIVKLRKTAKYAGIFMAHLGILLLLVVGFFDHHMAVYGQMSLLKNGTYDFIRKQDAPSVEVFKYDSEGAKQKPYVIKQEMLRDLEGSNKREFIFDDLPFDLVIRGFVQHSEVVKGQADRTKTSTPSVNGLFLNPLVIDPTNNDLRHGCYASIYPKDGSQPYHLLLHVDIDHPQTFSLAGELYGIEMPLEILKMPFEITLKDSRGEYYPNTRVPSYFSSDLAWVDDKSDVPKSAKLEMNKPMRHAGYTVYQAQWVEPIDGYKFSGFAVVNNPVDEWPKYCLYISGLGLVVHFGVMLLGFIQQATRGRKKQKGAEA